MEAMREFAPFQDTAREAGQTARPGLDAACLDRALSLLQTVSSTAVEDAALRGFRAASDFADRLEELSRTVEYLQIVAAGAVDRTRNRAAASPASGSKGWTTGWREDPTTSPAGSTGNPDTSAGPDAPGAVDDAGVDDGYRNTTEFLRARLRISATEARRRLSLAESILPRHGIAGRLLPAARAELSAAVSSGMVASRAATTIALALDRVRHACDADAAARMEHALTRTAAENDPDFLVQVARRWTDALDQDGAEPSEELLRRFQGAFIRRTRHGLHHLEIYATTDQFEQLVTVMNTATNPRSNVQDGPESTPGAAGLDLRSRPQRLLDGLVGACKAALAAGTLPAAGGLRPQVMVTIDYRDLLARLGHRRNGGRRHCRRGPDTGAHRHAAVHRARHSLHGPEDRLRRRHHPGPPRRRTPDPGHRPDLPDLPAAHPQGHHRPRPGLRLPRLHPPRTVVRGPPHQLLVPRRDHQHG
ncbi:DUF222 domain-containing protein [Pseudarthrobacter sp. S9]|uniref:DUF222 domain-containing protein n=1 Tax=Pseudarthrobacter sp. S9 TaxID=3418421 RepID=UPI003D080825